MNPPAPIVTSIDQLCPNCGLCCDSTLFADVELRAGDAAARLEKLGLVLHRKGRTKQAFCQPCAGFDGRLCRLYADRPKRCAQFECGLLKQVAAGGMSPPLALRKITATKKLAQRVRELLAAAGQRDDRMALTHRYTAVMAAPVDLAEEGSAERQGELMLAVNQLMQVLQRDFLQ